MNIHLKKENNTGMPSDNLFVPENDDEETSLMDDPNQLHEHYRFNVDPNQSLLRIDKFLMDRITRTSRNRLQLAAEADCIRVNGKPVKSNYRVKPMDVITIMMARPHYEFDVIPEDIPLDRVYEDDVLLVVNKPAGLVVHPGHGNYQGTLVNALAWYLKDDPLFDPTDRRVGLIHRIDKDTSGLLVIAKRPEAKTNLSLQFFNKTTQRKYTAVVWGMPKANEGRIEGNIGRNLHNRMIMAVYPPDEAQGKAAVTHYHVLENFGYAASLECRLETGRTHQIRTHLRHIGHPVFNDERYGGNVILKGIPSTKYKQFIHNCFQTCPRQALHAKTLGFTHPATGEPMFFDSELPDDMKLLMERWRDYYLNKMS